MIHPHSSFLSRTSSQHDAQRFHIINPYSLLTPNQSSTLSHPGIQLCGDSVWGCTCQGAAQGRRWQSQTRDSRLDKLLGTGRGPSAFLGGDAIPSPTKDGKQERLTPPEGEGAVSCEKTGLFQQGSKEPEIGPPLQRQEGLRVIRDPVIKAFWGWFNHSWGVG